jgi:hypothetical protein
MIFCAWTLPIEPIPMIPSRTVSIYGIHPQIAHLGEAASKIVVSSLYGGEEENLTQRRKGAKMKTRIGIAAKEHRERKDQQSTVQQSRVAVKYL